MLIDSSVRWVPDGTLELGNHLWEETKEVFSRSKAIRCESSLQFAS